MLLDFSGKCEKYKISEVFPTYSDCLLSKMLLKTPPQTLSSYPPEGYIDGLCYGRLLCAPANSVLLHWPFCCTLRHALLLSSNRQTFCKVSFFEGRVLGDIFICVPSVTRARSALDYIISFRKISWSEQLLMKNENTIPWDVFVVAFQRV